eukprot:gene5442-972_t
MRECSTKITTHNGRDYNCSMRVPFKVLDDPISGAGLYATIPLEEGKVVCLAMWRTRGDFQVIFHEADVFEETFARSKAVAMLEALPLSERRRILHHSYGTGESFVWCKDTAALLNHSSSPTVTADGLPGEDDTVWRAARAITPGEELTYDYESSYKDEPDWFRSMFPELAGEEFPDHTWW